MRNPLKAIRDKFRSKSKHQADAALPGPDYQKLIKLWPDGTWTLQTGDSTPLSTWDHVARTVMSESWRFEELMSFKARNPGLGAGMWSADPIPEGWKPSEKAIKGLAAHEDKNYDLRYVHYIVGQLTHLGNIRP